MRDDQSAGHHQVYADDYKNPVDADSYEAVYVYEVPVRLWHWTNVVCVMTLIVTGYLIGVPLPSAGGEASGWYVMGYIRFAHFAAGYIFAIGMVFRIWWAVVGNQFARQVLYLPVWSARWTRELYFQLRWYAFLEKKPLRYLGHNPLAHLAMTVLFFYPAIFMILSGFGMYSEATGRDSWQHMMFGWFVDLFSNTIDLHFWHRAGMWTIASFIIFHVYAAIREDIMSGQSVISTMFNGERMFKQRRGGKSQGVGR